MPLRYPMSVHWSGSDNLAIGTDVAAAKAAGKVAILDPATRKLTALHTGDVTVRVTNDSMREYTDEASLAPITTREDDPRAGHARRAPTPGRRPGAGDAGADASARRPRSARSRRASTKDYTASTTATVTSTAGDAALTASHA